MANDGTCRSCGAAVVWVVTRSGKRMPVDRDPVPDGNVVVNLDGIARYIAKSEPYDGDRFVSHFSTCPQRDSWRKGGR